MSELRLGYGSDNLSAYEVTIKSGAALSEVVGTVGRALVGIIMPATWTAASVSVKAGTDAGNLLPCYDSSGNLLSATAAAGHFIAMPQDSTVFAPLLQIASVDGSGSAVNQAADRKLTLILRRFLS